MKKILSFLFSFYVLLFAFFVSPTKVEADTTAFLTSFDVIYAANTTGNTHVTFNGTLENTTDKYYASSYSMTTGFESITNVVASDSDGSITPTIKTQDGETSINLNFNHHATGLGSALHFTFSFDTPDVAKQVGSIWEVNIPGVAHQSDFKNFTVHVKVPASFGKPSIIKPEKGGSDLTFTKDDLGGAGIFIAFGTSQTYSFTLGYHLKNDNIFPVKTEIALPPTTNYQDVALSDISPKPLNVYRDGDGNWLAQYYLLPSQKQDITAKGTISTFLTPQKETLSDDQRKQYLKQQPYWETNSKSIQQVAQDLKTPQAIYNYVVHHLQYDFSRVAGKQERLGAEKVLQNPSSAVCLEFTDLFIALARAAGIPAREIDGYAYTQNSKERPLSLVTDILHAWPEYYDDNRGTWVMVDPTWENTTKGTDYFTEMDFDHVAFVIKGLQSSYPVPAGGYKLSDSGNAKDVFISFGEDFPSEDPQVSLKFDGPVTLISGLPIQSKLTVFNAGKRYVPPQLVSVSTHALSPRNQTFATAGIPPFGWVTLPINFEKTSFLTNGQEPITIQVAGSTITKIISVYPVFLQKKFIIGGILVVLLCIVIFIITTKARRLLTT